jgi:hypothetical protein
MGMAASQARYLALTARKSNVEYEGQQVNQARTALANQSANTFNELLAVEVPTAPSTQDYTTLQYSYTEGTNTETITSMSELIDDADGYNYLVSHYHYSDVYTGVQSKKNNPQVVLDDNGLPSYVGNNTVSKYDATDSTQKAAYDQICKEFPNESIATTDADNIYTWQSQGTTYFGTLEDLVNTAKSAPDSTKPTENQSKLTQYDAEYINTKIETQQKAFVDLDDSGRPQTIRYEDSTANYSLNTETITDENAYNDAMNQYNYDMQVYEKKIADINAKTEKIQQEDRTLELRLRQLDTEQEALQTEMEAVKKVIEKNIESTFKTFE